nr:DUF2806 domain-containing protein [Mesorhizobium sp. dw_380]
MERAKPRLIAQETRRQFNIEQTVAKAISFAGESNDESAQEIPNEWFLRWTEGAQQADDEKVKDLWARILAAKAQSESINLRSSIMNLLMEIDAHTGDLFIDFICDLVTFKSLPFAGQSNLHRLKNMDVNLLEEMGLVRQITPATYDFGWLNVQVGHRGPLGLTYHHGALGVTQRGHALATALYGMSDLSVLYPERFSKEFPYEKVARLIQEVKSKYAVILTFRGTDTVGDIGPISYDEATWPAHVDVISKQYPELKEFVRLLTVNLVPPVAS